MRMAIIVLLFYNVVFVCGSSVSEEVVYNIPENYTFIDIGLEIHNRVQVSFFYRVQIFKELTLYFRKKKLYRLRNLHQNTPQMVLDNEISLAAENHAMNPA